MILYLLENFNAAKFRARERRIIIHFRRVPVRG